MVMRIYFAHPVNSYNTPVEKAAIALIAKRFPKDVIENPNQPHHKANYQAWTKRTAENRDNHKAMNYFFDEVLPACDACVAMPYLDGQMGLGVAGEAKWFLVQNKPLYGMFPKVGATGDQLRALFNSFLQHPSNGFFEIRNFTKTEQLQLRFVDELPLVLSHQETRLRTWIAYNKISRSYESAHEVSMSVPPGFYPK